MTSENSVYNRKILINVERGLISYGPIMGLRPKGFGIRHIQAILLFNCLAISFAFGSNLSVAMVAMITNSTNSEIEILNWDTETRGVIFSSQFWGLFVSSLLGGVVVQRYGAKKPLLMAIMIKSLLMILTPVLANLGSSFMIAKQTVEGLIGGFVFPCVHAIMGKWIHPIERGYLAPLILTGSSFGTIVMIPLSGLIATSSLGWPGTFYLPGCFGLIWSILWWKYGGNSPMEYKGMIEQERKFLNSIPGSSSVTLSIPWRKVMKSAPVWALIISQCGESWVYVMIQRSLPTYIDGLFEIDLRSNALLSCLPYVVSFVSIILSSHFSEYLINRGYLSVGSSRKIFNTIGMWIPALLLIGLGFVAENLNVAILLLTLVLGFNAVTHSGFVINHLDLSPNFAGTLVGICIAIGNIMSTLSPVFVGYVVTDTEDPFLWRIVYLVSALMFFLSNLVFLVFGQVSVQEWNDPGVPDPRSRSFSTTSDDGINFRHYMSRIKLS